MSTALHTCWYCGNTFLDDFVLNAHVKDCPSRVPQPPMLEPVRKMKPGYVLRPPNTDERLSNRERELLQTALRLYHNDLQNFGSDTDAAIAARLSLRLADPSKELVLAEVG